MKTTPLALPAAEPELLLTEGHTDAPAYGEFGEPATAAATGELTEDAIATRIAQADTEAQRRAAYAVDDPRYAGGDIYDLKNEQTSL